MASTAERGTRKTIKPAERKRYLNPDRGLPTGALSMWSDGFSPSSITHVERLLRNLRIEEVNSGEKAPDVDPEELYDILLAKGIETTVEVSGRGNKTFKGQVHPVVDNESRGLGVSIEIWGIISPIVGDNRVFIFTPKKGSIQDALVYSRGNVGSSHVLKAVEGYIEQRQSAMKKASAIHR